MEEEVIWQDLEEENPEGRRMTFTARVSDAEKIARCRMFARETGTDEYLATFHLKRMNWDLKEALQDYDRYENHVFDSHVPKPVALKNRSALAESNPEDQVRLISWNVNGGEKNLTERTQEVCHVLKKTNADIIFLQEAVGYMYDSFRNKLKNYICICDYPLNRFGMLRGFFMAILVNRQSLDSKTILVASEPFLTSPVTQHHTGILQLKCQVKGIPMTLINIHTECTPHFSDVRKEHMKIAFDKVKTADPDYTVIFGGDVNLRDYELSGSASKPPNVHDLWHCTGRPPDARFTWDPVTNDFFGMKGNNLPRHRFDRFYIRHPKKSVRLEPVYFALTGLDRIPSCQRFASDHWGILAHLDIVKS